MRPVTTPAVLLCVHVLSTSAGSLEPRQDADGSYLRTVCYPTGSSTPRPPCVSIEQIDWQCAPNGTTPLALEAHKQCLCNGSFFGDYAGCQACLLVHGFRSERDNIRYLSVAAAASSAFCGVPTPSAAHKVIFSSLDVAATPVTTGATTSSDRFPSQTEVSLYFSATGSQGPGAITGSATAATSRPEPVGTTTQSTRRPAGTTTAGGAQAGITSGATGGGAATTTSSSSGLGAIPTAAVGGLAIGIAAGAFAAVF